MCIIFEFFFPAAESTICLYPFSVFPPGIVQKSNQDFQDITQNEEENEILHEIFRVVFRCPTTFRATVLFISENRLPLGHYVAAGFIVKHSIWAWYKIS